MGPPGGGKGTLSKKIIKDFNFHHISTGDMLRAQVRAGTDLGKEAKGYMDSGGLVPDKLIIDMVLAEVKQAAADRVLLDGFPRTAAQAETLGANMKVDMALNLAVPNEEIVKRASGRWIHAASGRTYAYDYNPPKVEGKDDETGEPLIQRDDDKPESVRKRLQGYDEQTKPLLDFYRKQGVLAEFDGSDHPDLLAKDKRSDAIYKSLGPHIESQMKKLA
jgi:nucleoside-triphosphate--adenylate kinase